MRCLKLCSIPGLPNGSWTFYSYFTLMSGNLKDYQIYSYIPVPVVMTYSVLHQLLLIKSRIPCSCYVYQLRNNCRPIEDPDTYDVCQVDCWGFPTSSDTNRSVLSQKKAKSLKFQILEEEEIYYLYSEIKVTAQLFYSLVFANAEILFLLSCS